MKTQFSFRIESLLYGIENPKGAIEQVLFAKKVAEHEGLQTFNRLARATFDDPAINKALPGATPLEDTLLLGYEGWNDTVLHLCVRSGKSACKIATGYLIDRKVIVHNEYCHALLLRKLSVIEISEFFDQVWDNLESIQPIPKHLDD